MKKFLNNFFGIEQAGSNINREVMGGLTAFLSMSYVIFVNPIILSNAGMPKDAVFMATIISTALSMLIMGLYAKFPLGLAPCMSMNAFFAYSVVLGMGIPWQTALTSVFASSILFLFLAISGIRAKIIKTIPEHIKQAGSVGLGIFIAFISFKNAGIIVPDDNLFITFGGFQDPNVLIAFFGILSASYFLIKKNQYAVFLGMLSAALFGLLLRFLGGQGLISISPDVIGTLPSLPKEGFLVWPNIPFKSMIDNTFMVAIHNLKSLLDPKVIIVVLTFLFLDFFGTATTLSAAASQIKHIPEEDFENNKRIYMTDALGSLIGSIFGTSNLSTYIESVSGIMNGARTGLMSVVAGLLFLLSMFLYPLLSLVTSAVTTPAMVLIGVFMMQNIENIDWSGEYEIIIPSFITIVMMPLTGSIALGLVFGFLANEICMLFAGRIKDIPMTMHIITLISFAYLFTL